MSWNDARDTQSAATDATSTVRSMLRNTMEAVTDRTSAARDWATETADAARRAPGELADTGADYIKASPYLAIGLAAALGYVLGRATR